MTLVWTYGVRNTTLLTLLAFVAVGLARRRPVALLAMLAWLVGFEALWQWAYLAMSRLDPHMWRWIPDGWTWAPLVLAVAGPGLVVLTRMAGLKASRPWVLATIAFMGLWIATGLHANYPGRPFDVGAEIVNMAAKTAWALAYLVPLAGLRWRLEVDRFAGHRGGRLAHRLAESRMGVDVPAELPGVTLK